MASKESYMENIVEGIRTLLLCSLAYIKLNSRKEGVTQDMSTKLGSMSDLLKLLITVEIHIVGLVRC